MSAAKHNMNTSTARAFAEEICRRVQERVESSVANKLQESINDSIEYAKVKGDFKIDIDGETKTMERLIFEMNRVYIEMSERLHGLAEGLKQTAVVEVDKADTESTLSDDLISSLMKRKEASQPGYKEEIEKIVELDKQLDESCKLLKQEHEGRLEFEKEIYAILKEADALDDETRSFFNSAMLEELEREAPKEDDNNNDDKNDKKKRVVTAAPFVKRNIKLVKAKSSVMKGLSLTDEEKLHLEAILAGQEQEGEEEKEDVVPENPYKIKDDELFDDGISMSELDARIASISEVELASTSSKFDLNEYMAIEKDANDGKYWKNEARLKKLEDELARVKASRLEVALSEIDVEQLIKNATSGEFPEDFEIPDDGEEEAKTEEIKN